MIKAVPSSLLITRNKGFWTTNISRELFPNRLVMSEKAGLLEQIFFTVKSFFKILVLRPNLIFFGTSNKIVSIFAYLRRIGFFRDTVLITDKQYLKEKDVKAIDGVIVYSSGEIMQYSASLRPKFIFLYFPSKKEDVSLMQSKSDFPEYIFCGGNNLRDHNAFIEAIRGTNVRAVVVTSRSLTNDIPANCLVYKSLPLDGYLQKINDALFVVVPLLESDLPHGHSDISIALSLCKPVITTRNASIDSYTEECKDSILVPPGDIASYRKEILRLWNDKDLLDKMVSSAKNSASKFSYEAYARGLYGFCEKVRSAKKL